jgi:hypothetical protein
VTKARVIVTHKLRAQIPAISASPTLVVTPLAATALLPTSLVRVTTAWDVPREKRVLMENAWEKTRVVLITYRALRTCVKNQQVTVSIYYKQGLALSIAYATLIRR